MYRSLLKMSDLNRDELYYLLDLASKLKNDRRLGIPHPLLAGKTLGMIFRKSSTRTRVSFETGMYQLGGYALFLSSADLQIGRGEPIEDTARVLGRYLDGIMIRTFAQEEVEQLALHSGLPVINGLTDYAHPCQVLADLMTIREYKGGFDGRKLCYIGDGNNMCNSLIVGCLTAGMDVAIAVPEKYRPAEDVLEFAKSYGGKFMMTEDPFKAAEKADVLYTDVWASMGMEGESEQRRRDFKGYQINRDIEAVAAKDVIVQHCLPAHREEEITADVFERHAKEIFDEAENRLHAQKAVMAKLMK
ncbi:MAG: ornithine carbamoyltransferase [Eubacteriales bacterium]|jgi:ornithine carbamoyltransferase